MKSCLSCSKYVKCTVPTKGYKHNAERCKNFSGRGDSFVDFDSTVALSDQEWSIENKFHEAVSNTTGLPVDTIVDDRDVPAFPNFMEFTTSRAGLKQKPYIKQLSTATVLLGEYCNQCSDVPWLKHKLKVRDSIETFIERVELLQHGVCPRCSKTKSEMILKEGMPHYNELAACIGQRAGKSYLVSLLSAYITHLWLKLQKPNEVYDVGSNNMFFTTFVALTFGQAKELLYDPFYALVTGSPWFLEYHKILNFYSKHNDLYKINDTFIIYKHRNLTVSPSGPDKRTLRGRTRNLCSIDEIAYFDIKKDDKVRLNATEIHKSLSNSLVNVRAGALKLLKRGYNNIPNGMFLNISSPSSMRDKIMELYNASQGASKDFIYGVKMATWEFTPKITRKDLESSFKKDPVEAERDFGANPPLSDNAFIGSFPRIQDCFVGRKNPIALLYLRKRMSDDTFTRYARIANITRSLQRPSLMAIDAGYSQNSFAMCIGSIGKYGLQIDLLAELQPMQLTPLNYTKIMEEIIVPIIEKRNVQMVVTDRWQNIKLLHDIEDLLDIQIYQYSLKYDDIHYVRQKLYDTEIMLPAMDKEYSDILDYDFDNYPHCFKEDTISHFILQCMTVRDTGNAIVKGENTTDDLFRAMVLCVNQIMGDRFGEISGQPVDEEVDEEQEVYNSVLAVARSFGSISTFSRKSGSDGKALGIYRGYSSR